MGRVAAHSDPVGARCAPAGHHRAHQLAGRVTGGDRARDHVPPGGGSEGPRGVAGNVGHGPARLVLDHPRVSARLQPGSGDDAGRQPSRPRIRLSGRGRRAAAAHLRHGGQCHRLVRHHPGRGQRPAHGDLWRLPAGRGAGPDRARARRLRRQHLRRHRTRDAHHRRPGEARSLRLDRRRGHGPFARPERVQHRRRRHRRKTPVYRPNRG